MLMGINFYCKCEGFRVLCLNVGMQNFKEIKIFKLTY
jgi:hypothetical protein